jgi:glycosyltransferase involved in cell wall biosynthesis
MVLASMLPGDQTRLLTRMAHRVPPIHGLEAVLSGQELPDIVFGFNLSWEYPALAARQYARRRALPFVLVPFAHLGESKRTRMARNNTMDHQRRLAAAADRVLALTEAEVRGFAEWAIPVEHMSVVGGGLDPIPPLPDSAAVLVRTRLSRPFALFVGRATHDKGAIDSAQAVLQLRREGLPISLALVGRIAPEFSRFFSTLTPAEREIIRPLGVLSEVDKHCLLEQAQMLLLPSRTDSFGLVLLEAWIHETPVIGAQAGGVASVISDGEDGLLTPFGDVPTLAEAIRRLATDAALNQQLGKQGKHKVLTQYTWAQVADKVLAQIAPLLVE